MICRHRNGKLSLCVLLTAVLFATIATAGEWPTYRHDIARSGITAEQLKLPLSECWTFKTGNTPRPAWEDPKPEPVGGWHGLVEKRRNHFDDVFQPVASGGAVYFGSSADNKLYCLDAASGKIRWTKITGGPLRLAPTLADRRVYLGSDDGYAYCLNAKDGSVAWKFRAAPEDRRLLGSGKMISRWPIRSGVLVDDGIAYFSAGIFPADGVFFYAVDAQGGRKIWCNDNCGEQPHSRISPQGYLLASESHLYVPMGRVSPAAFDRRDGRLVRENYFNHEIGGTYALLADDYLYTGTEKILAYNRKSQGDKFVLSGARQLVVTHDASYIAADNEITVIDRKKYHKARRQGDKARATIKKTEKLIDKLQKAKKTDDTQAEINKHQFVLKSWKNKLKKAEADFNAATKWRCPIKCPYALILAGNTLFAGGKDQVVAVDTATGKQLWAGKVDGTAKGLAVADGRLLVGTDKGLLYSFASKGVPQSGPTTQAVTKNPFADSPTGPLFSRAAETILAASGVKRGYCLVLGLETGELALELARRSQLMIYAVSPDAAKVAAARKTLDAAGVYGSRVCVEQCPLDKVPYSDYFANLIVSETALLTGELPVDPAAFFHMVKPLGGVVMIGQPAERPKNAKAFDAESLAKRLTALTKPKDHGAPTVESGDWAKITRGPLPGAGSWTHQYAEPGNTACGDDTLINAPLGVLWFGAPGPAKMPERHTRAAAPLSLDGRMFVQGENTVMAYDIYNGVKLWQRDIPGAIRTASPRTCGNMALGRAGLFLAAGGKCLRLDPETGKTKATYTVGDKGKWEYVACVDGLLYGSRDAGRNTSDRVFAIDIKTAKRRWTYKDKNIPNNTITIADGKLFLVAKDAAATKKADLRTVVALDAKTGRVSWKKSMDLAGCGGYHAGRNKSNAMMSAMYNNGVLTIFGVYIDGHYWKQFYAGKFNSRRVAALSAKDGELLWSRHIGFRVRPLIVGDTFHAEPWAFDLHTGKQKSRSHPVTGKDDLWQFARPGHHCGCPCAAANCLFFRSLNLGYYDLLSDYGTMHFGAHRPGCWINFIPAGGLLLVPEASAGCMCAFPTTCTVVFQPVKKNKAWAWYSAPGPMTPVKRLALNFGAPGDRKDAGGKLWLGYPRHRGSLVLQFKLNTAFHSGGRFATGNSTYAKTTATDDPWIFASAAKGMKKCVIPIRKQSDGAASYTVRLAFADPDNDQPGRRVFDIKLQGKLVKKNFDIAARGGRDRAVFEQFDGIEVADNLVIELLPKIDKPTPEQMPVLHGVEIVRE